MRPEVFMIRSSASIQDIYVKPEYRKTGIGKEMINRLIGVAKENRVEIISLGVAIDNITGKNFWAGIGFDHLVDRMSMQLV